MLQRRCGKLSPTTAVSLQYRAAVSQCQSQQCQALSLAATDRLVPSGTKSSNIQSIPWSHSLDSTQVHTISCAQMMAGSTADEKPAFFSCKPEAQPAAGCENVGSGPGTPGTPSPAISMDHGQHSTLTSHSSKCFEAEASSCSEVRGNLTLMRHSSRHFLHLVAEVPTHRQALWHRKSIICTDHSALFSPPLSMHATL